ncbi:MAG: hypothetical protein H6553_11725 [Chitinophagales bacterium]|nr:hypothetical protein [Chitinophagales bacterium]
MDKDQLKNKAEETVNGIKGQIAELETKLESATGDARAKIEEQLEKLNLNKASIQEKLDNLEDLAEEKLGDLRALIDGGVDSLKDTFGKITGSLFGKKEDNQ